MNLIKDTKKIKDVKHKLISTYLSRILKILFPKNAPTPKPAPKPTPKPAPKNAPKPPPKPALEHAHKHALPLISKLIGLSDAQLFKNVSVNETESTPEITET